MVNVTKGDVGVRESWESGKITLGEQVRQQVVKTGLYSALKVEIMGLQRGQELDGVADMVVDSAELTPGKGSTGKLVVTLVPAGGGGEGAAWPDVIRSWVEVEMAQIERPLLTHSELNKRESTSGDNLARWRAGGDERLKRAWKYLDDEGEEQELNEEEQKWARKILKGVESYLVFAPVVTRTTHYRAQPEVGVPGGIETPPLSVAGFAFLKTGDGARENQDGTWERVEAWTGADEWDADLYGAEGGGGAGA